MAKVFNVRLVPRLRGKSWLAATNYQAVVSRAMGRFDKQLDLLCVRE
jgi:hypothetical protein